MKSSHSFPSVQYTGPIIHPPSSLLVLAPILRPTCNLVQYHKREERPYTGAFISHLARWEDTFLSDYVRLFLLCPSYNKIKFHVWLDISEISLLQLPYIYTQLFLYLFLSGHLPFKVHTWLLLISFSIVLTLLLSYFSPSHLFAVHSCGIIFRIAWVKERF